MKINKFLTITVICFSLLCNAQINQTKKNKRSSKKITVPNLVGLTYKNAEVSLQSKSLNMGAIVYQQGIDSVSFGNQIIYEQNPSSKKDNGVQNFIQTGQPIDLYIVEELSSVDTLKKIIDTCKKKTYSSKKIIN